MTDVPRYIGRSGSGVFPPLPLPDARSSAGKSSCRLRLPSRVSPLQHRKPLPLPARPKSKWQRPPAPPEVSSPTAFSRPWGATYPGEIPTHRLRCALRVSHPPDALLPPRPARLVSSRSRSWGLPFGALLPPTVPYVLSDAATLVEFARSPRRPASPSGLGTPSGIPSGDLGFSQDPPPDAPLGFSPSRVSCPTRRPPGFPSARPLSRFSGSAACWPHRRRPRVSPARGRSRSLSRPT